MGASGWNYWTAYTDDLEEMLEQLQDEVFAAGDYVDPWDAPDDYHPASIEKLVDNCGEEGTHSILDIDNISTEPVPHDADWEDEFLTLFPLTRGALRRIFDTTRPTREEVEANEHKLAEIEIQGWSGRWILTYEGDEPSEYYIFGTSGD